MGGNQDSADMILVSVLLVNILIARSHKLRKVRRVFHGDFKKFWFFDTTMTEVLRVLAGGRLLLGSLLLVVTTAALGLLGALGMIDCSL
jgi:hypothetical protein